MILYLFFSLQNQKGQSQTFDNVKGEEGAVLVFVRSANWCPYCQVQLLELKDVGEAIAKEGYNIVTISYDAPDLLNSFSQKYKFPYVMLSDPQSAVIKDFGILDESYKGREGFYGIPKPRVYIVDGDGSVLNVLSKETY